MAITTGIAGAVTSWASNTQFIATGSEPAAFTLEFEGQEFDTTTFASAGISSFLKGLSGWRGQITQQIKTPATGDLGLVTFTAGYTTNLTYWDLAVDVAEHETTTFGATTRAYIPGKLSWGGSFGGYADDTALLTMVGNSSEPATGTFKVREAGGTDDTLSGSIFTTRADTGASPDAVVPANYTYRGSGALTQSTPSAGTTIFPTGAVARPTTGSLVLTATTGQTFTGDAFWTRAGVRVAVNELIVVTLDFRGSGALSIA